MADNALIALGRAVRELRTEKSLNADELAAAAGLTPKRLDAIEAARFDPAYDELLALADELRVTPSALVNRADAATKNGNA